MAEIIDESKPLPIFRRDLELYKGPDEEDGSPTYNILDPVSGKYYKISWGESIILQYQRPGMLLKDLCHEINTKTALKVTEEEVKSFYLDAFTNKLLYWPRGSESIQQEANLKRINWFQWLLTHYLYIRIPLLNPDKFLTATYPYIRFLFSKTALILYLSLSIIGILFLVTELDSYLSTFTYFFNFEGLIIYGVAITSVKLIHEFCHAYTAKKYGLHVPSMGIAFIVLWPVLYTDVTHGWKLQNRRERVAISFAGIAAELLIAGLSTIGWAISEPGLLQSVFFVVSSVTWISTLIINLNPAVRFDGYYILCDLWGMDNLQMRAYEVLRWKFRQIFLGIDLPHPEPQLSKKNTFLFIVYSSYVTIYRIFLYLGIAIFVYFQFTKVLGIFLFIAEVAIFMIWPVVAEINALIKIRHHLKMNYRLALTLSVLSVLLMWVILPLPHKIFFPAITVPVEEQIVYVPYESNVEKIFIKRGDEVKASQPLIQLESPRLNNKIAELSLEKELLEKQIEIASMGTAERTYLKSKKAELNSIEEELSGYIQRKSHLLIRSDYNGKVFDWNENLRPGLILSHDFIVGKVADSNQIKILCFIPEQKLQYVKVGDKATFRLKSTFHTVDGYISKINPSREEYLTYPQLASINKGSLPVSDSYFQEGYTEDYRKYGSNYRYNMVESYYMAEVLLDSKSEQEISFGQIGEVQMRGPWHSLFMDAVRYVSSILIRESGL